MDKHIILTNGRSGSNYFSGLLNLHPQITNYGEVLGEWTLPYKIYDQFAKYRMSPESYLDYIYNSKLFFYIAQVYSAYAKMTRKEKINFKTYNQVKSLGVKDFSINFLKRDLDNYLTSRKDIFVINLYRKNSLARLISTKAMQSTGIVKTVKKVENTKVFLNHNQILEILNIYEQEKKEQFELISALPQEKILNISYEDYFTSEESQKYYNNKIFEFLKVSSIDVKCSHKKILSRKLSNIIENYEEVVKVLKDTQYEQYLLD